MRSAELAVMVIGIPLLGVVQAARADVEFTATAPGGAIHDEAAVVFPVSLSPIWNSRSPTMIKRLLSGLKRVASTNFLG